MLRTSRTWGSEQTRLSSWHGTKAFSPQRDGWSTEAGAVDGARQLSNDAPSAVTAIMLAERTGYEADNACSIGVCGNYVDVGRHKQERNNRPHPATSAMVH